jgi:hypothetical protein
MKNRGLASALTTPSTTRTRCPMSDTVNAVIVFTRT